MHYRHVTAALLVAAALPTIAHAAVLYSDNFNLPTDSTNYNVNVTPAANAAQQSAEFGYDYSAFGIPAAPGSSDTLGLRLRANIPGSAATPLNTRPAGTLSGLSVSPTTASLPTTGNYQVSFYAWSNFNGAANASGLADNGNSEGGTNNVLFAVGTSGTVPLSVGNTTLSTGASMDGVAFATTGDGGITNDYRIYPKSGTIVPGTNAAYVAGSNANTAAYYQSLPSLAPHSAPAIQQALSTAEYSGDTGGNTQAGQTQIGAFGFAWHQVVIAKDGANITWWVDGSRLATYDPTALGALGGNNIALGVSDANSSTTRHASLLFTVFDNLVVTDNITVPEPTTLAGLTVAGALSCVAVVAPDHERSGGSNALICISDFQPHAVGR